MYLEKINSPTDVKKLKGNELYTLADEIRETLLSKLSAHGGHIGPNLGMVEMTIALHYVFDSPKDKIVFDVSHQSYPHKILTGRKEAFTNPAKYDDVSGYTNPAESEHDIFEIGHTSTSVSLACGLARARDLKGTDENIIAVIGDGSLSGGEALEALDYAGEQSTNMIIIVNDNDQSISENHGGLYKNLKFLRDTNGKAECNIFKSFGLDYVFIPDGHNIAEMIKVFESVKNIDHPIVVHIFTVKGKGFKPAEIHREAFHGNGPFNRETGEFLYQDNNPDNYANRTAEFIIDAVKKDPTVVVISSGTPTGFGLSEDRRIALGKNYIDVGIAEEHAVALSSGIAKNGGKPIYCVFAPFIQRTYDQLQQDLCVNKSPALILVFAASVYGMNDVTHLGIFDIPLMSNIPELVYLAPTCKDEYFAMLEWGMKQTEHPVAIRVPCNDYMFGGDNKPADYNELDKYSVTQKGSGAAVIALGTFYELGKNVVEQYEKQTGNKLTLINPKYITGVDVELLEGLKKEHSVVITLEDGILEGGFGEKIAAFYGITDMKVKNYGIKKSFPDRFKPEELLLKNGVSVEKIVTDLKELLG